jgi:signal transduction histidine kinase
LLDVSRAASGGLPPLMLGHIDLPALVAGILGRFAGRSRRHRFVAALAPDLPPVVAERDRLEAVFYNLLDNAVKYSPRGGVVTVRAQQLGEAVECNVEDEGVGIPPAAMRQLFTPYYRAVEESGRVEGAGLGLYISRLIVEAQGGTMRVASEVGRGTAVCFTVPANSPGEDADSEAPGG